MNTAFLMALLRPKTIGIGAAHITGLYLPFRHRFAGVALAVRLSRTSMF